MLTSLLKLSDTAFSPRQGPLNEQMRLHLYRVEGGYFVCPADAPVPGSHAAELKGRAPDMRFLSRDTAGRQFIEDHMRTNGAVLMDQRVADMMLSGYPGWESRAF